MQILDTLTIKNGDKLYGIVDYSATKHIIFINLTNNSTPDLTKNIINWRLFCPNLRWAVYSSMYGIDSPVPILINKKDITHSTLAQPNQKIKRVERVSLSI